MKLTGLYNADEGMTKHWKGLTLNGKSLVQANERVTEGSEVRGQKLVKQFTKMIDSIFLYSKVILINHLILSAPSSSTQR